MNNICIKPHVPESEDGFTLPSSEFSVSVTILLFNSLSALSLATLFTAAVFHASSNEGGTLQLFILGTGKSLFNLTSSYGIPTDYITTSLDKSVVFPSFYDTTTFLASSITSPYLDTFYLASLAERFDTCGKNRGDEK